MNRNTIIQDQAVTVTYHFEPGLKPTKSATCAGCPARLSYISKTSKLIAFRDAHRDH